MEGLRLDGVGSSQKVMIGSKEVQVVDVIDISSVGFDVSSCIQINVLEAKA